jgi:hypothetical protein
MQILHVFLIKWLLSLKNNLNSRDQVRSDPPINISVMYRCYTSHVSEGTCCTYNMDMSYAHLGNGIIHHSVNFHGKIRFTWGQGIEMIVGLSPCDRHERLGLWGGGHLVGGLFPSGLHQWLECLVSEDSRKPALHIGVTNIVVGGNKQCRSVSEARAMPFLRWFRMECTTVTSYFKVNNLSHRGNTWL